MGKIAEELQNTSYGIICVTSDNISSPWIYFEAGAISILIDESRVMPILFDIEGSKIERGNPLLQFQYSRFDEADFLKLIKSVARCCVSTLSDGGLEELFKSVWSTIKSEIEAILSQHIAQAVEQKDVGVDRGVILEEVLQEVRNQRRYFDQILASSRLREVDPKAARDLLNLYRDIIEIANNLRKTAHDKEAFDSLASGINDLRVPLDYILRRTGASRRSLLGIETVQLNDQTKDRSEHSEELIATEVAKDLLGI